MKHTFIIAILAISTIYTSCKKPQNTMETSVTSDGVINDFVNIIAIPKYNELEVQAAQLHAAITALKNTPNFTTLALAKNAWKNTRRSWELCESFLFGPVSDYDYDPNMDTWPIDFHQMDSLLASTNSLSVTDVGGLDRSLKGFHPLEYMLWGADGQKASTDFNNRQFTYMLSLSENLHTLCSELNKSWQSNGGNYQQELLQAGGGNNTYQKYANKQAVLLTLTTGIADICDEVGNGKLYEPFINLDSFITESPYAHNSMTDFTNNILGAQNVYLCTFNNQTGASLSSLVANHNMALDIKIKQQFQIVLLALNNVTTTFENGIFSQRPQIQAIIIALQELKETIDGPLKQTIITHVKN